MATVGQLQDTIANELASEEFGTTYGGTASPVFTAINAAVQELSSTVFTFNITTNLFLAADTVTTTPTLDAGVRHILGIFLHDASDEPVKWELQKVNIHDLGRMPNSMIGSPRFYCITPQTGATTTYYVNLRPTPDKAYSLNVVYIPDYAPYTSTSDTDVWTNQGYFLTKALAKYHIYSTILANPQQAALELRLFERLKQSALAQRDSNLGSGSIRSIW